MWESGNIVFVENLKVLMVFYLTVNYSLEEKSARSTFGSMHFFCGS